jgi:hypothetical protein
MATRTSRKAAQQSSTTDVVPSGAPSWVTPELIAHTLRVWQRFSDQPLTPDDALEIINGAGRLIESFSGERGKFGDSAAPESQSPE